MTPNIHLHQMRNSIKPNFVYKCGNLIPSYKPKNNNNNNKKTRKNISYFEIFMTVHLII